MGYHDDRDAAKLIDPLKKADYLHGIFRVKIPGWLV
jgi:hypothetical protein